MSSWALHCILICAHGQLLAVDLVIAACEWYYNPIEKR